MYIFGDFAGDLWLFAFYSCPGWVIYLCFVVTFSMPPRKKVTRVLTSVGENHGPEPSADHISMHYEGKESSGEAGHLENRNIMAAIEDLQHSQVAMWVEFQSFH